MSYNKKAIADALSKMNKARKPKQVNDIIMDPEGQNKFPGLPTRIPSNNITMETTPYPVLGVDNFGNQQMMYPGANYTFPGADYVDEYPMMQIGGQRPILYVDPNDPAGVERYTAYNDSLDKFNKGNKNYLTWINYGAAGGRGPFWRRVIESALPDDYVIPDQVNQPIGQKVTEATFPIALIVGSRRPFGKEYYKKTVDLYAEPKQPVFYKDSKEHIQDKQQQLIDAGYDIGKADGIWGPKSQAAWEEFQKTQTTEPEVTPQPTPEQAPTLEVAPLDNTPQRPVQTQTPPQAAQVPSGYNVWTHNGQPLDPAVYGWAPSNSPRQISQFADTHSLKRANEAYNKLGATPWATTGNKLVTDLYKPYFSKQAATNAIEQTAQQLGVPVEQLQIVKAPAGYSGYVVIQNLPQQKYGGLVTGLTNTSGNLLMNEQGKRMMAKSGSLYATNKLFLGNPLVTKRKKAVFVPGHDFQTGGEQTESTIENPSTVLPRSTINEYYNFRRANLIDLSLTPEQAREKYTSVNPVLFDAYTFFKNKGWTPVDSSTYHDEDFSYCSSKGCFYDDNSWNTFISANSPAETPIVERPLVTPETSNVQTPEQPPILPVIPLENVPQQVVTPQQPVPTQTPPQQPVQTNQPQVTPAPQQPSETPKSSEPKPKYHKEYNPYTGRYEPMSPKQKIELDGLYSRDLPMPENWQPELIETYRRQTGGAIDWKSRIASTLKLQQGGTPSEIWKQHTGTSWSEAKRQGLTDGSAAQNIALANRVLAGEFGESQISYEDYQNSRAAYDKMVVDKVMRGATLDDLVTQRVGTRSGLINRFPDLFNQQSPQQPKTLPDKPSAKKETTKRNSPVSVKETPVITPPVVKPQQQAPININELREKIKDLKRKNSMAGPTAMLRQYMKDPLKYAKELEALKNFNQVPKQSLHPSLYVDQSTFTPPGAMLPKVSAEVPSLSRRKEQQPIPGGIASKFSNTSTPGFINQDLLRFTEEKRQRDKEEAKGRIPYKEPSFVDGIFKAAGQTYTGGLDIEKGVDEMGVVMNEMGVVIDDYTRNFNSYFDRFLVKKGYKKPDSHVVQAKPTDKIKEVKPEVKNFYEQIEVTGDKHQKALPGSQLLSYRSQWDANKGFTFYNTEPKNKQRDVNKTYTDVEGVGHFILDASPLDGKTYMHPNNFAFINRAVESDNYIPMFESIPNSDGQVIMKYKKPSEMTEEELKALSIFNEYAERAAKAKNKSEKDQIAKEYAEAINYDKVKIVAPLRQYNFDDVDFNSSVKAPNFKQAKYLKTKDGKLTNLLFTDPAKNKYGRFDGVTVSFIFKDSYGNNIVRDFSGTINDIQKEGADIKTKYGLKDNELVIGYHDVGSFSAKPAAVNGKLSVNFFDGYNNDYGTGSALIIPKQK